MCSTNLTLESDRQPGSCPLQVDSVFRSVDALEIGESVRMSRYHFFIRWLLSESRYMEQSVAISSVTYALDSIVAALCQ